MKKAWIILLLLMSFSLSGQVPIRFLVQDYCRDSLLNCTWGVCDLEKRNAYLTHKNESEKIDSLELKRLQDDMWMKENPDGTYLLEEGKEYSVILIIDRAEWDYWMRTFLYRPTIHSRDTILNAYTISKLFPQVVISAFYDYHRFYKCGEKCEGYCRDYYWNGKIRLEGDFIKGYPTGELKLYDEKGWLKRVEQYDEPIVLEYPYPLVNQIRGNLIYERLIYYESGKLKMRKTFQEHPSSRYVRMVKSFTLYDEDGNVIRSDPSPTSPSDWRASATIPEELEEY